MAFSPRQFNIELYLEHLEEASSLYEQRLGLRDDPELSWRDLAEYENRIEAHIDALVVGDQLALDICRQRASEGDEGECYAAVKVFCRQGKGEFVAEVWGRMSSDTSEFLRAILDAFIEERLEGWSESLEVAFEGQHLFLYEVVATLFGYERYHPGEQAVLKALSSAPEQALPSLVWALGRIGGDAAAEQLKNLQSHPIKAVRQHAIIALLRLRDPNVLSYCLGSVKDAECMLPLALAGRREVLNEALQHARQKEEYTEQALLVLGLLGDVSAVYLLYSYLDDEMFSETAAYSLQLITGAGLYEDVFVEEEVSEDELFEDEIKTYRETQKLPEKAPGQAYGEWVRRLSHNPHHWQKWLNEHQSQFKPAYRYRLGSLYSPVALYESLRSETIPFNIRRWLIEELNIQYHAEFKIEADMLVCHQDRVLSEIKRWAYDHQDRLPLGLWGCGPSR